MDHENIHDINQLCILQLFICQDKTVKDAQFERHACITDDLTCHCILMYYAGLESVDWNGMMNDVNGYLSPSLEKNVTIVVEGTMVLNYK